MVYFKPQFQIFIFLLLHLKKYNLLNTYVQVRSKKMVKKSKHNVSYKYSLKNKNSDLTLFGLYLPISFKSKEI